MPLYFKLEGTVSALNLRAALQFTSSGPHEINVLLRPPNDEEQRSGYGLQNALTIATVILEPSSPAVADVFRSLSRNAVPEGCSIPEGERTKYLDENGNLRSDTIIQMKFMPQPFRDFSQQVQNDLWDYTRRTALVLRWRMAGEGPYHPFAFRHFSWSLDGNAWRMMPSELIARVSLSGLRRQARPEEWNEVCSMVRAGKSEPLGHELHREAWEHRISSPRSALIVGIAALEAGFKGFVSELAPVTQWLLENLPSPPLHKMLTEYLPLVPVRNEINGRVLPPPRELIETITDGVTKRNTLVHVGTSTVTYEEVDSLLLAVLDVLWMLDYYRGLDWALEYIRPETRANLTATNS